MDNPYIILIAVVWCAAAVGSLSTRSAEPFAVAFMFSALAGFVYFLFKTP